MLETRYWTFQTQASQERPDWGPTYQRARMGDVIAVQERPRDHRRGIELDETVYLEQKGQGLYWVCGVRFEIGWGIGTYMGWVAALAELQRRE